MNRLCRLIKISFAPWMQAPFPARLLFSIEGKAHGVFYVEIKNGKINVEPYEYYDRNAIITATGTNLIKLINGKLDPVVAFTTGKLKVDGDVGAALELIKYIK